MMPWTTYTHSFLFDGWVESHPPASKEGRMNNVVRNYSYAALSASTA